MKLFLLIAIFAAFTPHAIANVVKSEPGAGGCKHDVSDVPAPSYSGQPSQPNVVHVNYAGSGKG